MADAVERASEDCSGIAPASSTWIRFHASPIAAVERQAARDYLGSDPGANPTDIEDQVVLPLGDFWGTDVLQTEHDRA